MPTPDAHDIPTPADAARDLLPAFRLAAREKYGRGVRMAMLSPFLAVLLKFAGELLMKWLADWLASRDGPDTPKVATLVRAWERDRDPAVAQAMFAAARGETGE